MQTQSEKLLLAEPMEWFAADSPVLMPGTTTQFKCETCTLHDEMCKKESSMVLITITSGENTLKNWETHQRGRRHRRALSEQYASELLLEETVLDGDIVLEMKEEQELFIENPENEANVFMATMDLKARILLFVGAGAEPESHLVEA